MLKKSIILCSYNGEKYIEEQLESLISQTVQPDEVLIFDDCSSDNTAAVIRRFIESRNLANWKLIVNTENVGWKKNFIFALRQASGDLIFPCDQDDIWNHDKIEKMSAVMEQDGNVKVLVANYTALYEGEEYRKISGVFGKNVSDDGAYNRIIADEKGVYILRPGCVMAVRKDFLQFAMKYYFEDYPHDALLWRSAVYCDGLYQFNYCAIQFRRHSGNASDKKQHAKAEKYESICYYIKVIEYLIQMTSDREDHEKKVLLQKMEYVWTLRKRFYETRNVFCWLKLFVFYRKYYLTIKALIGDLYIVMKNK